jgi:hypothetical protein
MRLPPEVTRIIARTCSELNFSRPETDEALELTAAYLALQDAGLHPVEAADVVTEVRVGSIGTGRSRGDDGSLDAIAVLIGDACVTPSIDRNALRSMLAQSGDPRIRFILVQATGVNPAMAGAPALKDKLNGFLVGIQLFLNSPEDAEGLNANVRGWLAFRDEILAMLRELDIGEENISLRATLVWPRAIRLEDIHRNSIRVTEMSAARRLAITPDRCRIEVWNIDQFMEKAGRAVSPRTIAIPAAQLYEVAPGYAEGVRNYAGYVAAGALVRAARVSNRPGARLDSSLFVDNVRAYLGPETGVNREIMETLSTRRGRSIFHLLSNGVALLARIEKRSPDRARIELVNAQIINGCQTTHALEAAAALHGDAILDEVIVPVRVVITDDEVLIDQVILGLNRQQPIEAMHLLSRRPYVMRLSAAFVEIVGPAQKSTLYFARRFGEHAAIADRSRVVTIQDVLYAFHSAYGTAPHADAGPARLLEAVHKERMFHVHQPPGFYVAGALMLSALMRELARRGELDGQGRWGARNQAIFAMRLLVDKAAGASAPFEQKGERGQVYLDAVLPLLLDANKARSFAQRAVSIVLEASDQAQHVDGKLKGRKLEGPLSNKASTERMTEVVRELATAG